jgi:hypothetical protein
MVLLTLAIPIGATLGLATWAILRGRGGLVGALLCAFFAIMGALMGGFAVDAIVQGGTRATLALGASIGAVIACLVEALGFGKRPKRVAWVDQKGVATHQPDDGRAPRSLV